MHKNSDNLNSIVDQLHTSGSGYDLLRYVCLPDLLGKDTQSILYVLGKNIARKMTFTSIEEIYDFFLKTGWGHLTLIKEKRREFIFELTGEAITNRIESKIEQDYRIESGFLAEAIQQLKSIPCECIEELKNKKGFVQFNVIYSKD
ncbi:YslB family protein [Aquibacillus kalidii]|uniref:YslB family protein n=1 Tax=Aquibacillus kalidii TaxID=2762597 RepID=UPI001645E7F1|nr:YslB family protein [Aquibacillus kalidii]